MIEVSPTEDDIFGAVGRFLVALLPPGTPVRQGQVNRVSEPSADNFAVMWPLMVPRLSTNLDEYLDCVFQASVAGTTMTVTAIDPEFDGRLAVGLEVFGLDVQPGTQILALGTGTGGVGTYQVAPGQTLSERRLAAGTQSIQQTADFNVQVDFHGTSAVANAAKLSTLFKDQWAQDRFAGTGLSPLYADDPRQAPFLNGEQQIETKTVTVLHLQVQFKIVVPQQFSDELKLSIVDATAYPAT